MRLVPQRINDTSNAVYITYMRFDRTRRQCVSVATWQVGLRVTKKAQDSDLATFWIMQVTAVSPVICRATNPCRCMYGLPTRAVVWKCGGTGGIQPPVVRQKGSPKDHDRLGLKCLGA